MKNNNNQKVRKAIIAVAGYGTRFLPITKSVPKQMLPIVDKPIVQHVVEEAVASGITDIILVTQHGQHPMEDHFDSNFEMEKQLEQSGKLDRLEKIKEIPKMANFIYMRQTKDYPYGNGTPLLVARHLINKDESFAFYFGDDLVKSKVPCTKQLLKVFYQQNPKAVLAVQEMPDSEVERYGTVKYKKGAKYEYEASALMEKMPLGKNPSNMCVFGRFICTYDVIREAENTPTGKDNELWMADILNSLAKKGKKVIAQPIEGKWMTTGDPLRYMKTQVEYALEREDIGSDFRNYLKSLNL